MNCDVCGSEAENGRPCLECLTGQNERLLAENESFREVLGHREAQLYQVGGELREALLQNDDLKNRILAVCDAMDEAGAKGMPQWEAAKAKFLSDFSIKRKGETGWRGCEKCGSSEFPCTC